MSKVEFKSTMALDILLGRPVNGPSGNSLSIGIVSTIGIKLNPTFKAVAFGAFTSVIVSELDTVNVHIELLPSTTLIDSFV